MEQTPIHEASPWLAAASDQGMASGFEADDSQCCTQFTELGDRLAIQPPNPGLTGVAQARPAMPALLALLPLHKNLDRIGTGPDQSIPHPSAETASVSHQVQGFQHTGLASAIIAGNQVQARGGLDGHRIEAAQTGGG